MSDSELHVKTSTSHALAGFGNIFRAESARWWRTRRWWTQTLIWLVMVNGLVMVADFWSADSHAAIVSGGVTFFFTIVMIIPILGLSIMMQGIIVGDKQDGIAAWILSKPVSRPAFVLAKFSANLIPAVLIMIILQSGVAYLQISGAAGGNFPLLPYLGKTGLATLHLLFYHALSVMLGTLFQSRRPVAGIPLIILLGLLILDELFPPEFIAITPGGLMAMVSESASRFNSVTLLAVPAWIVVFMLVALWRFSAEEF